MEETTVMIEQMAIVLSSCAHRLESMRLQLFLQWLVCHSSKVRAVFENDGWKSDSLTRGLLKLFESLPMQGLFWEYQLILDEITWWRDLDAQRFVMISKSEGLE